MLALCFLLLFIYPSINVAAELLAGENRTLNGVNSFQQPVLAGLIIRNELLPFEITDNNGVTIVSGLVEDRVVKSSDLGTSIFQSRLRELKGANNVLIKSIGFTGFKYTKVDPEYLLNGIGDTSPTQVNHSSGNGDQITYHFSPALIAANESSFTSIATNATGYSITGKTSITVEIDQLSFSTAIPSAAPADIRTTIFPQQGLWWNPSRSGHGVDVQIIGGDTMLAVWYTYRNDNTPIWYLGTANFSGNSWEAQMDEYHWDGQQATAQPAGRFGLEFNDQSHATFWWQFNGQQRVQEAFEVFQTSTEITTVDYSGTYFETAKPGYGMSLSIQGNTEFSVLYFYDQNGQSTWALGSSTQCSENSYQVNSLQGFCPSCPATIPITEPAGKISLEMYSNHHGILSTDINLNPPLAGHWKTDHVTINNLSSDF